jgi:hypothetical protein
MTQNNPNTENLNVQVLLLEGVSKEAVRIFEKQYGSKNIEYISHALAEDELIEKLKEKKNKYFRNSIKNKNNRKSFKKCFKFSRSWVFLYWYKSGRFGGCKRIRSYCV